MESDTSYSLLPVPLLPSLHTIHCLHILSDIERYRAEKYKPSHFKQRVQKLCYYLLVYICWNINCYEVLSIPSQVDLLYHQFSLEKRCHNDALPIQRIWHLLRDNHRHGIWEGSIYKWNNIFPTAYQLLLDVSRFRNEISDGLSMEDDCWVTQKRHPTKKPSPRHS